VDMVMNMTYSIRKCMILRRRERFAAEHPLIVWMRPTHRLMSTGPKSLRIVYAAAKNQSMPWPEEALRTVWFPLFVENMKAMTSEELRRGFAVK
jgi:hypothetical protein